MFRRTVLLIGLTTLLLLVGCDQINIPRTAVGETITESHSIELGNASQARVNIAMGIGSLVVNGGASNLMDADFTYNIATWQPEVDYTLNGDEGRLSVTPPQSQQIEGLPDGQVEYNWDISLNNDVPINLDLKLGIGKSELDLSDLNLSNLGVQTGVGDTTIDMSGIPTTSYNATIQGGVGRTVIYLPDSESVGVRVDTKAGLGSIDVYGLIRNGNIYTNAAFETAETIVDIDVQGGVGAIRLEVGR